MTDDLAGQIRRDLYAIADHYDEALEPVRRGAGSHVKTSKEPPLPVSAHILDVRREALVDLLFWVRFLLDEVRDINDQPIQHGPRTTDVPDLVGFVVKWAAWLVEKMPDDADNLAAEAGKHARELRAIAAPERREWLPIGDCPVTVADADGNSVVCGAKVRAYPERAFIACPSCGTEDTMAWWMSQIVPEGADKADASSVIAFVAMRAGIILNHDQIRKWASLGCVLRHGRDAKGRTLYSSTAVLAYAQDRTKEDAA